MHMIFFGCHKSNSAAPVVTSEYYNEPTKRDVHYFYCLELLAVVLGCQAVLLHSCQVAPAHSIENGVSRSIHTLILCIMQYLSYCYLGIG
jgi:hypothetical protein